ncbi:hypothetical protein BDR26DRAFT_351407 [Obelidium mucronatum]|nr:hypothetical protein BDR26DRAFT_351407 [Obelidium mucronatum]
MKVKTNPRNHIYRSRTPRSHDCRRHHKHNLPPRTNHQGIPQNHSNPTLERKIHSDYCRTTEYDFRLLIPRALPPTALPEKGAIDYRIEAVFHLPEKAGYDELVAQRRIEIVRTHINFDGPTVPGPPVNRPVITAAGTQPIYAVSIQAPEYAFIDSGILPVTITLLQGPIKKIQTVVLTVEERRKYALGETEPNDKQTHTHCRNRLNNLGREGNHKRGRDPKGSPFISSIKVWERCRGRRCEWQDPDSRASFV